MTGFVDPQDWQAFAQAVQDARNDADRLHRRAMLLGYNVGVSTHAEMADHRVHARSLGNEPSTSFLVWRIDHTPEDGQIFGTARDVEQHLDQLETLPRFCIGLAADPEVEAVVGDDDVFRVTVTDAAGSRLTFSMRVADIESATEFCVHAESPPTIGNWRKE